MPARLLHRSGPGAGQEVPLPPEGIVIGRGEEAQLRIADRGASRRHCRIFLDGGRVRVKDLDSKNGTLVNGLPVEDQELAPGDVVQVGSHAFQILSAGEDPLGTAVFFVPDENHRETMSLPALAAAGARPRTENRLAAAFRLAGLLGRDAPLEQRLERTLSLLLSHTPATRAAFLLYEGDPPRLTRVFTRDAGRRKPARLLLGETMVRKAFQNGESLLYQNLAVDPSGPDATESFSLFYAAVCAPLPSPAGPRGIVYLDTLGGEGELGEGDLHLAAVAGALAGSALETEDRLGTLAGAGETARERERYGMTGRSPAMKRVYELVRKVAGAGSTVLIRGESGTGKELVARAVHRNSPRRNGPFVAVNCGAIPLGLLESELFGYERGAFTGADRRRPGRFQASAGGVLFLDEISELPLESQAKILRALEERAVVPLGATKPVPVDVRLVAATNQDLDRAVEEGRFRQDLFYRLKVIEIELPPLRERPDDIPLLVDRFLEQFRSELGHRVTRVDEEALGRLRAHSWPGNVRELRNTVERALVLASGDVLSARDVAFLAAAPAGPADETLPLREAEALHIRRALERCEWNKARAARELGIERSTLYEKLKTHGIERPTP